MRQSPLIDLGTAGPSDRPVLIAPPRQFSRRFRNRLLGTWHRFFRWRIRFLRAGYLLKHKAAARDPVLIYTLGRVATEDMEFAIKELDPLRPVEKEHHITGSIINDRKQRIQNALDDLEVFRNARKLEHVRYLRRVLRLPQARWKIITAVRDPVLTSLSSFFASAYKNLPCEKFRFPHDYFQNEPTAQQIRELRDIFFLQADSRITYLERWFDDELLTLFPFKIFDGSFPKERGYQIYHCETADLLLLKVEAMNANPHLFSQAIESFLGLKGAQLKKRNSTGKYNHRRFYDVFKEQVEMPAPWVDQMLDLKFIREFYTEQEVAEFRRRWRSVKNASQH